MSLLFVYKSYTSLCYNTSTKSKLQLFWFQICIWFHKCSANFKCFSMVGTLYFQQISDFFCYQWRSIPKDIDWIHLFSRIAIVVMMMKDLKVIGKMLQTNVPLSYVQFVKYLAWNKGTFVCNKFISWIFIDTNKNQFFLYSLMRASFHSTEQSTSLSLQIALPISHMNARI